MIGYFKDFLLNIFIIFSPMACFPYIRKLKSKTGLHRFLLFIVFSAALVISMLFPINLYGLIYDFRSIPLVVGSLYGGALVSCCLFVILNATRFFTGSPHGWLYAVSLLPSMAAILLSLKTYHGLKRYQKIVLAVILSTFVKLLTFSLYLFATSQLELLWNNPIVTIETYVIQGIIIGIYIYIIQFLEYYYHMQDDVIKNEKIKLVSEMAASVAHEIRNPLTAVRGFIQLLGAETVDKEKKEFYQSICLEELNRAELIISDYLSLAKPDPIIIENIDVHSEIRYLSNLLQTYANYNNIQIDVCLSEEPALAVNGDRYKFRQALVNIGKNGIEAMQSGGILAIRTGRKNDQVVITICDSGSGMTPEQISRLGTPYYSTKDKGTGLGTMVSFGIIKNMNGKIDVKSELGKGTQYDLAFPAAVGK